MAELFIYPSHGLVRTHRAEEARRAETGVCWGTKALTMYDFELQLIQEMWDRDVRILSPAEERSWLRMFVSSESPQDFYPRQKQSAPGFIRMLQSTLQHCGELGLDAAQLGALGADPSGLEHRTLRTFASLYRAWEHYINRHKVRTHHLALLEMTASCQRGTPCPDFLKDCRRITFRHTYRLSLLQMRVLEALDLVLETQTEVLVEVPHHESQFRYFRSTGRLLSQFEQTGDKLRMTVLPIMLPELLDDNPGLLHGLVNACAATEVRWDRVSFHESSSKARERLAIVEQIQQWMQN